MIEFRSLLMLITFVISISANCLAMIITGKDDDSREKLELIAKITDAHDNAENPFSSTLLYNLDSNYPYKGTILNHTDQDTLLFQQGYWIYHPSFPMHETDNTKVIGALIMCNFRDKEHAKKIAEKMRGYHLFNKWWKQKYEGMIKEREIYNAGKRKRQ